LGRGVYGGGRRGRLDVGPLTGGQTTSLLLGGVLRTLDEGPHHVQGRHLHIRREGPGRIGEAPIAGIGAGRGGGARGPAPSTRQASQRKVHPRRDQDRSDAMTTTVVCEGPCPPGGRSGTWEGAESVSSRRACPHVGGARVGECPSPHLLLGQPGEPLLKSGLECREGRRVESHGRRERFYPNTEESHGQSRIETGRPRSNGVLVIPPAGEGAGAREQRGRGRDGRMAVCFLELHNWHVRGPRRPNTRYRRPSYEVSTAT